jgi:hypothetical protein
MDIPGAVARRTDGIIPSGFPFGSLSIDRIGKYRDPMNTADVPEPPIPGYDSHISPYGFCVSF